MDIWLLQACDNRKNLVHLQELKEIFRSFYQLFVSVQESKDIIVSFHQLMQFWAVKHKYGLYGSVSWVWNALLCLLCQPRAQQLPMTSYNVAQIPHESKGLFFNKDFLTYRAPCGYVRWFFGPEPWIKQTKINKKQTKIK